MTGWVLWFARSQMGCDLLSWIRRRAVSRVRQRHPWLAHVYTAGIDGEGREEDGVR